MPFDACFLAPLQHSHAGHLRAVVTDNGMRSSAPLDDRVQLARHAYA